MELVNDELHNLWHIVDGAICIARNVHTLRAEYLYLTFIVGLDADYGAGLCLSRRFVDEVDRFATSYVNILAVVRENVVVSICHIGNSGCLGPSLQGYKGQQQTYTKSS